VEVDCGGSVQPPNPKKLKTMLKLSFCNAFDGGGGDGDDDGCESDDYGEESSP
jgi:hypothetical protein